VGESSATTATAGPRSILEGGNVQIDGNGDTKVADEVERFWRLAEAESQWEVLLGAVLETVARG
jgi:hypothetical protein